MEYINKPKGRHYRHIIYKKEQIKPNLIHNNNNKGNNKHLLLIQQHLNKYRRKRRNNDKDKKEVKNKGNLIKISSGHHIPSFRRNLEKNSIWIFNNKEKKKISNPLLMMNK